MRIRGAVLPAVVACCLCALSSCAISSVHPNNAGQGGGSTNGSTQKTVEHRYSNGPVTFTVRASASTIDTAQNLRLTLVTKSTAGWTARLPGVGKKLGNFSVASRTVRQPRLSGSATTEREVQYELEPFLPGTYVIPPLSVSATNGTTTETIASDPIRIAVTSLIPKGATRPLKLKALAGPIQEPSLWPEAVAGASVLIAALAATVMMLIGRIRRRFRRKSAAVPPWVRARKDLDHLVSLDLPINGRHKEFYNRISLLVRRYIEEMFDVSAPEQTTEEFLYSVRYSTVLGRHRRFLAEFLGHCDLVKFAAYLPAQDEVHRAIRSCREFIDSTSRDYSGWTGEEQKDR